MAAPSHSPCRRQGGAAPAGRERRQAFVDGLPREERMQLEQVLADVLEPLPGNSRITGGYCPLPSEISPLPALKRRPPGAGR